MIIQSTYENTRKQMRAGDVIFFRNGKPDPLSAIIKILTGGPTHCALVLHSSDRVTLAESTIRNGVNGVQQSYLDERLQDYVDGCAWWCPLAYDIVYKADWAAFENAVTTAMGRPYDIAGLAEFLFRRVVKLKEEKAVFCSAFVCIPLEAAGIIPHEVDYAAVSPEDLVKEPIYAADYYQILGNRRELNHWNSVPIAA